MNKLFLMVCTAACSSMLLTGCLFPRTRSLGVSLMPSPLQHRSNGDDDNRQISIAGSGYYGRTGVARDNVKDVDVGGGDVSVTYRFWGLFSPLFVNASAGAFKGYTGFACTTDECAVTDTSGSSRYREWLKTSEGEDTYSTWAAQERIMVGADFNPGPYLIVGLAGGIQMYQEGGDYYRMRKKLENAEKRIANSSDGKSAAHWMYSMWLGSHLGRNGQYGNFVTQFDFQFSNSVDEWTNDVKFTYTHPTGFFVGYQNGSLVSHNFYFGKEFIF